MAHVDFELPSPILVAAVLTILSCGTQSEQVNSQVPVTTSAEGVGANQVGMAPDDLRAAPLPLPTTLYKTPIMGEPWRSWGVRSSNGTIIHASSDRLVIAFGGGKTRAETLESLYAGRLETHGWLIEAQWQEDERRALSMIKEENRLCILFSPTEDSIQQLIFMEIPGPDARLGDCVEGSPLSPFKLSELESKPEVTVP